MQANRVRLTMTLMDVYKEMRAAGIPCSPTSISAGIASGAYPFGRVVSTGETGRRTLEIFRVDFDAWLLSKIPRAYAEGASPLSLVRQAL